jgi:hypothetical protein
MQPPGGVTQAASQLAVGAGDRVGDERVGPAGIVAVDGGDQADPGHLGQVLVGDTVAAPEASGQAVGQSQVGEDDPRSDGRAAGALTVQEPRLDLVDGLLVARAGAEDAGEPTMTRASQSVRPGRFGVGMEAALIRGGSTRDCMQCMQPVRGRVQTDRARRRLQALIVDGTDPAGSRVTELQIAGALGMSRTRSGRQSGRWPAATWSARPAGAWRWSPSTRPTSRLRRSAR